jgi:peptidoglycan hydrolase-like protein with peptidoglycan-binding domain
MAKGEAAKGAPTSRAVQYAVAAAVLLVAAGALTSVAILHNKAPAGHAKTSAPNHGLEPVTYLKLTSASPAAQASNVAFHPLISLKFSSAIAPGSAMPTLSPPVPGRWSQPLPGTLEFRPTADLFPLEKVTVDVPGGSAGLRAANGDRLASGLSFGFTVRDASVLRLQQLLAELGYLPVAFNPSALVTPDSGGGESTPVHSGGHSAANALSTEPTVPDEIPRAPMPGAFSWRYTTTPPQLATLWSPARFTVVTEGAVMAFEADHGLPIDGVAGANVWRSLLDAVAQRDATTRPYTWVVITETDPETLYVWRAGHVVYQTPVNTGISVAPTQLGTWPVYLRYTSVTMSGYNPDGSYYSDPGVPWVAYFHGGDAVHGFWRSSFGFPQSLGCVELPIANAAIVYPYDTYGTLVTVTTGALSQQFHLPAA